MKTFASTLLFCSVLLTVSGVASAAAPGRVNLQGVLRTDAGAPQDGVFEFKVQIFPDAVSTTPLLDETFPNTPVTAGVFAVEVGKDTPTLTDSLATATEPQVQFIVNGTALPKQPLSSTLYALHAQTAATAASAATVSFAGITGVPAPTCAAGMVLQSVSATGAPTCVPVSYRCGSRYGTNTAGSSNVTCAAGETLTGGGCYASSGTITASYPAGCPYSVCGILDFCFGGARCSATYWYCSGTGNVQPYAVCCSNNG